MALTHKLPQTEIRAPTCLIGVRATSANPSPSHVRVYYESMPINL